MSSARLIQFRVVYAVLTLNFILPAISYITHPQMFVKTFDQLNRVFGGGAFPRTEDTAAWHMLAVGNVMTLGFMCALLWVDLRRFYPVLPALLFLKGFSALYSLGIALANPDMPAFYGVFLFDGFTVAAMAFFAVRAHAALAQPTVTSLPE
jgi:hypothetical protein